VIFRSPNHPNGNVCKKVFLLSIVSRLKNVTARASRQIARKVYGRIAGDIRLLFDYDGEAPHHDAVEAQSVFVNDAHRLVATIAGSGGHAGGRCRSARHRFLPSLRFCSMWHFPPSAALHDVVRRARENAWCAG
jgi:hypothetical protein